MNNSPKYIFTKSNLFTLFAVVTGTILGVEFGVKPLLETVSAFITVSEETETIVEIIAFVAIMYPALYYIVFRPLRQKDVAGLEAEVQKRIEERYSKLFESSRDAIMTLEPPEWKFTSGNPATVKMFGAKDEAEFLSYEPWRLSPETQPDGRPSGEKAKEMIEKAMREGVNAFEWVHKKVTGEDFFAEVLLSKVEQGKDSFLHAVVRDITGRKKNQDMLEKFNQLMVGRELEMVALKKEIEKLKGAA